MYNRRTQFEDMQAQAHRRSGGGHKSDRSGSERQIEATEYAHHPLRAYCETYPRLVHSAAHLATTYNPLDIVFPLHDLPKTLHPPSTPSQTRSCTLRNRSRWYDLA